MQHRRYTLNLFKICIEKRAQHTVTLVFMMGYSTNNYLKIQHVLRTQLGCFNEKAYQENNKTCLYQCRLAGFSE